MKKKILLIGAGGHARVVASVLSDNSEYEVTGVLDSNKSSVGEKIGDYVVIGTFNEFESIIKNNIDGIALCMGNNNERLNWYLKAKDKDLKLATVIHPTAFIEKDALIGEGSVVCAGAIICSKVKIEKGVIVNTGSIVDHEGHIQEFSSIAPGCRIAGRVSIGKKAFIGIGATISNNISIGNDATIGAGAVVIGNVGDGVTASGVPAIVKN